MGWEGHKSLISLILGIIVGALGLIPILNNIGAISYKLPDIPEIILLIILVIGSAYLVIDGFMEVAMFPSMGWISIFGGAGVTVIGILKLLGKFTTALAFVQGTFLNIIFLIVGFLLLIGAFMF